MMPYVVGKDPDTGELIVGLNTEFVFFLRGPAMEEKRIRDLVEAANMWVHNNPAGTNKD